MSASELPASPLIQALERILSHWQAKAPTVAQSLRSGLSREQIEIQLQTLPFRVPEEVYQLYQWRNGSEDRRGLAHQVEFMPQYLMLSLEEAIAEYEIIQELLLFDFEEDEEVEESKTYWFPLFARDGENYVIQGDIESKATAPIFNFSEVGLELSFNSLTDMMRAIAECFEMGAYSIDDYSYLDWDDPGEEQIWFKYQPHRIAKFDAVLNNAAAILNDQAQQLSDEERLEALAVLVRTQHPQALPLLIQEVERLEPEVRHLLFQLHHAPTRFEKADALEALPPKQIVLHSLMAKIRAMDSVEAIRYLWNFMKRNDSEIRDDVLVILAKYGISESVRFVEDAENTKVIDLLFQAIQQSSFWDFDKIKLLGSLGDPRVVDILLKFLRQIPLGSFNVNKQVLTELETPLQISCQSYEWRILLTVIETLETLGASRAVEPLFQITQQQQDPTLRLAAGRALKTLGDSRSREIFTQLLEEGTYTPLHFEQMGLDV
jgi:HEAT repeat protein